MRWMIKLPGVAYQEITPTFENLEFEDQVYKNKFFRRNLNVDLTLSNDDFTLVWDLEKANDPCLTLPIKIQLFEFSNWVDKWEGFISLKKGEYDLNRCTAKFKPETSDSFQCIIDSEKENVDLLDGATTTQIDTIIGDIEYTDCVYDNGFTANGFDTVINPCYPSAEGWTLIYSEIKVILDIDQINEVRITLRAARQTLTQVSQPGPGWIDIGSNKWVAPVPVRQTDRRLTTEFIDITQFDTLTVEKYQTTYTLIDVEIDNAIDFKDVLLKLVDCDFTIVSDFFDINADGTAPDNLAYQYATEHLQSLYFFQASDVINADASQNATNFEVKKGELLDDILDFFKCELFYDSEEGDYRIEHVSYRKAIRGADLLTQRFSDIEKSFKYKYDTDEVPLSQLFKFKFDSNSDAFDNAIIEYDSTCSNGNEETLKLKQIVTNISELKDNDKYEDENFKLSSVLIAVDTGVIKSSNGALNYPLAFKPIIEALHVYGNPLSEGVVNGNLQQFQSTKPIKIQEVVIKMSIGQYINNFGPNKEYKTQLGWGSVKSAKYSPGTQLLTIQLLH